MLDQVKQYIEDESLFSGEDRLLVGVSGGVDSVVLSELLMRLGYAIEIAHVNYQLRAEDSEADEQMIRRFCAERDIELHSIRSTPTGLSSVQHEARNIRYAFFEEVAERRSISFVAVAQHQNDQAETVLLNLLRGGGLDGISGMRAQRPIHFGSSVSLVRPLLNITREQIESFASDEELEWREDISNLDLSFTRARIRHETIPALESCGAPGLVGELAELALAMTDVVDHVLPERIPDGLPRLDEVERSEARLSIASLLEMDSALRAWYILRLLRKVLPGVPIRRSTVKRFDQLLVSDPGKRIEFENGSMWRERHHIRLVPVSDELVGPPSRTVAIENRIEGAFGVLRWESCSGPMPETTDGRHTIFVDEQKITGRLLVRPWQNGDRFRPFGMRGKKKVKAFLTDQRVPSALKKSIHVLCDQDEIVWVLGQRMSDDYRVDGTTRQIRKFEFSPARGRW